MWKNAWYAGGRQEILALWKNSHNIINAELSTAQIKYSVKLVNLIKHEDSRFFKKILHLQVGKAEFQNENTDNLSGKRNF